MVYISTGRKENLNCHTSSPPKNTGDLHSEISACQTKSDYPRLGILRHEKDELTLAYMVDTTTNWVQNDLIFF